MTRGANDESWPDGTALMPIVELYIACITCRTRTLEDASACFFLIFTELHGDNELIKYICDFEDPKQHHEMCAQMGTPRKPTQKGSWLAILVQLVFGALVHSSEVQ